MQLTIPVFRAFRFAALAVSLCASGAFLSATAQAPFGATTSIVAWDSATGDLGVGVLAEGIAAGSVIPYASAGAGAIATQGLPNASYGPRALELLASAAPALQAGQTLTGAEADTGARQFAVVDSRGGTFTFTGSSCRQFRGSVTGRGYAVSGNALPSASTLQIVSRAFETASGNLSDRLLASLEAAEAAPGARVEHASAALLVVRSRGGYGGFSDRLVDIRVDDDSLPVAQVRKIYRSWERTFLIEAQMRSIREFNRTRNYDAGREEMQRVVAALNTLLRDRPDDPEVLSSVAWTLASYEIDQARALELAKRAATLAPGNRRILDTLAECHFLLGHFDEAIAIETELVAKEPGNDGFWRQLQKFREGKQKSGR